MNEVRRSLQKKKIGVLNFQHSNHNYGAVLQAAALQYALSELGFDAIHIDYKPKKDGGIRKSIGKILRFLKIRKSNFKQSLKNKEAFERFREIYLRRTSEITTPAEFTAVSKEFDAVVVGSDQVWRPSMAGHDPIIYFLGSVPNGVNRVAYAASFGESVWEAEDNLELTSQVGRELRKFKAISCREDSGRDICERTFGLTAAHVLDPVLLVDENFFESIVKRSDLDFHEIVYYKLDKEEEFNLFLRFIEDSTQKKPKNLFLKENCRHEFAEVADWVGGIYFSNTVITDSFHCLCLALLFSKEILYCPNVKRGQSRVESLFRDFRLHISKFYDVDGYVVYHVECPKTEFRQILESKRSKSRSFILNANI